MTMHKDLVVQRRPVQHVLSPSVYHSIMHAALDSALPHVALQIAMLDERLWFEFQKDAKLRATVEKSIQDRLLRMAVTEHHHSAESWLIALQVPSNGSVAVRRLPPRTLLRSIAPMQQGEANSEDHQSSPISVKMLKLPLVCSVASMTLAGTQLCHQLHYGCETVLLAASLEERLLTVQNLANEDVTLLIAYESLQTIEEIEEHCTM